jgi:hypothetical protein
MKKITLSLFIGLILISKVLSSVVITGKLENTESRLVTLAYAGSASITSPNYYGSKDLCTYLNDKNEFKIVFESVPEYCVYFIFFNNGDGSIELLLKDKDSINISLNSNKSNETFIAKGNGSFFANYFAAQHIIMPHKWPKLADEDIISYWEHKQTNYLKLLDAFKNGKYNNAEDSLTNENTANINRLINSTLIDSSEFEIIKNRVTFSAVPNAIYMMSVEYLMQNIDKYINLFKDADFNNRFLAYDYSTDNLVNAYVRLLCLKDFKSTPDSITKETVCNYKCHNFENFKKFLKGNLLEKTIADKLYNSLMYGNYADYTKTYNENKNSLTNNKYISTLNGVYNNYLTALDNKEFNLNSPEKVLNDSTINVLLKSLEGQKVYLILWKIDSETCYNLTPIFRLPELRMIQSLEQVKNIKFIDICLGDDNIKQHWASMIINHNWKGTHYLYSSGNKNDFREKFNFTDKMKNCSGALYEG